MKNSMLLLLSIFTIFASCNSDDDGDSNNPSGGDPIMGRWNIYQYVEGENIYDAYTYECVQDSYVYFSENMVSVTTFASNENGVCIENIAEGSYENIDGFYYIEGEVADISIDGNTLTWREGANSYVTYRRAE